jgi:hypothetical protein
VATDRHPAAATEFLAPVRSVFPNDHIDFNGSANVNQVKHPPPSDGGSDGAGVQQKFGLEKRGDVGSRSGVEFDDQVHVPCHTRLGVVASRDGAGQHVGNTSSIKTRGDQGKDVEFFSHGENRRCLAACRPPDTKFAQGDSGDYASRARNGWRERRPLNLT